MKLPDNTKCNQIDYGLFFIQTNKIEIYWFIFYPHSNVVLFHGSDDVALIPPDHQDDVIEVLNLTTVPFYDRDNDFSFLVLVLQWNVNKNNN